MYLTATAFVRVGVMLKLTDLAASVKYTDNELVEIKHSSGYIPPELLCIDAHDSLLDVNRSHQEVRRIKADPSQDMWALGCVLYLLCTGFFVINLGEPRQKGSFKANLSCKDQPR